MQLPIYLDYAATTPVDERVSEKLMQFLTKDGDFGNPSSVTHLYGHRAREAVEIARAQVASLIGADPEEIIWTSGATEAANLALLGAAHFYARRGKHAITVKTEHSVVLDTFKELERQGFEVTYLDVNPDGLLDLTQFEKALRDDTALVSVMHVNNEIGVIHEIQAIGALTRRRGIIFHVDAAQSIGKIPVNVKTMHVDLLSMSAHKVYGPKGVGALFVSRHPKVRLQPLSFGGGQERGLRSGTLPTHQIAAMGEAFAIAEKSLEAEHQILWQHRRRLMAGLQPLGEVYWNGHPTQCVPGIMNVSFNFIDADALMTALTGVAVSSGSACTTASLNVSHVLLALGRPEVLARSAIRLSIGRMTTPDDIDFAITHIGETVKKLRTLSPLAS